MDINESLLLEMVDAIIELPISVKAGGQLFYIYPPSFGSVMLISGVLRKAGLGEMTAGGLGIISALKLFKEQKELIGTILAICSFENRKDACNSELLLERTEKLKKVSVKEATGLLTTILGTNEMLARFCEDSGINKENRLRQKILKIKNENSNSVSFGAKTIYGSLLGQVCEKFHWTLDYAVWGISFINLNMLVIDQSSTIFLTDEERKQVRFPKEIESSISADDPLMKEEIEKFLADA